jgi:hypothetical protein
VHLLVAFSDQVGVEVHVVVHLLFLLPFSVGLIAIKENYGLLQQGAHQKNYLVRYLSLDGRATRASRYFYLEAPYLRKQRCSQARPCSKAKRVAPAREVTPNLW